MPIPSSLLPTWTPAWKQTALLPSGIRHRYCADRDITRPADLPTTDRRLPMLRRFSVSSPMTAPFVSSLNSPSCAYREKSNSVSSGRDRTHLHATKLCACVATDNASHTFTSGKNEVMGGFVDGEARTELSLPSYHWPSDRLLLATSRVSLLKGANNQGADRGAGTLGATPQLVAEWSRDVDRGSDRQDLSMAWAT